jgi:dephospho-CoA kinase
VLNLKKIAVTGSLGAGKSTVCSLFQEFGAYTVSADQIVHQLLSEPILPASKNLNTSQEVVLSIRQKVVALLGNEILYDDKDEKTKNLRINKTKVANIVFDDKTKLEALTKILHPIVMNTIEKEYQKALQAHTQTLFVAEVPVLFEMYDQEPELKKRYEKWFDATLCVVCDKETAQKRFLNKTHDQEALTNFNKRSKMQLSEEEKVKRSDYILANNGRQELQQQVLSLYNTLIKIP